MQARTTLIFAATMDAALLWQAAKTGLDVDTLAATREAVDAAIAALTRLSGESAVVFDTSEQRQAWQLSFAEAGDWEEWLPLAESEVHARGLRLCMYLNARRGSPLFGKRAVLVRAGAHSNFRREPDDAPLSTFAPSPPMPPPPLPPAPPAFVPSVPSTSLPPPPSESFEPPTVRSLLKLGRSSTRRENC